MTPIKRVVTKEQAFELRQERVKTLDKMDPQVPITLGGKDYILEFNNRAVKRAAKELNVNLFNGEFTTQHMTNPEVLTKMLAIGLSKHHPDITEDQVDDLFSFRHFAYYMSKLTESLSMFTPDLTDVQEPTDDEQKLNGIERPM